MHPRALSFVLLLATACGGSPPAARDARRDVRRAEPEPEPEPSAGFPRLSAPPPVEVEIDESADHPDSAPPELVEALHHYDEGRWAEAALAASAVVEGQVAASPEAAQLGQLWLGKALYRLGYPASAASAFGEIVQRGSGHPGFSAAVRWLGRLSHEAPDPDLADLGSVSAAALGEGEPGWLRYAVGRALVRRPGHRAEGARLLAGLPEGSAFRARARILLGTAELRDGHAGRAARAFEEVAEGPVRGTDAYGRELRELARLSLARVYFERSTHTAGGFATHEAQRIMLNALALFERVDPAGPYGPDAALGAAWAAHYFDDHARARGHLERVPEEYLRATPEVSVLSILGDLSACRLDEADAGLGRFHRRFDGLGDRLDERVLDAYPDNPALVAELAPVIRREAHLPPELGGLEWRVHMSRRSGRLLALLDWVDAQAERLAGAEERLRSSTTGARIVQEMALQRAFTTDQLAEHLRELASRLRQDAREAAEQIETLEVEREGLRASCAQSSSLAR